MSRATRSTARHPTPPPAAVRTDGLEGTGDARLAGVRTVVDCRWLALKIGAARVIELLLADLRTSPPPGEWVLWGEPELVRPFLFEGAVIDESKHDPRAWAGQRELLRVPAGDVVVYTHQIRPLRPGRSVTIIHDTIPLRYGGARASRLAKRVFFRASATVSSEIVTDSHFSKTCIVRDLGVSPSRVHVMRIPVDGERAAAIERLRDALGQENQLLYVGRFSPHKNLHRLCQAFSESRFATLGGTLVLVGGWDGEVAALRRWLVARAIGGVDVRPACSDTELDRLMATSRALVLPSLEEGYGLPAFEAAASGLPVAASRTGAMTDLDPQRAVLFDAMNIGEMRAAIDEATSRPARPATSEPRTGFRDVVLATIARAAHASGAERCLS